MPLTFLEMWYFCLLAVSQKRQLRSPKPPAEETLELRSQLWLLRMWKMDIEKDLLDLLQPPALLKVSSGARMLVGVGRLRCARILITAAPVRPFASLLAVLG